MTGGIWTLGVWVRKAVACFKLGLMGHCSRRVEDSGAEGDLNCRALDQKVLEEKLSSMCPRDGSGHR